MKKIKMILFVLLLFCFMPKAYAADGVSIESVTLDSKSENVEIMSDATFEGLSLKFDVKFDDINDFVKYKLVIKNSTDSAFELAESTSSSSYITYEYGYEDGTKVLAANSSKTMYISIKYSTAVPITEFNGGNYTETKSFTINLEDGTDEITVPGTSDSLYCYLVLLIGTLVLSIALLKVTKNKKYLVLVVASMILIPLDIHAIEKLKIIVESKIEINNPNEITKTIYWAIQENGTTEGVDLYTGDPGTFPAYKLVISNKKQEGVLSGSFAGTKEFIYDEYNGVMDVPWINMDSPYFAHVNEVKVEGRVVPTSTSYWFFATGVYVDEVSFDLANLNTTNVTNMEGMFANAGNHSKNMNIDLSGFNTSNVTNMKGMFANAGYDSTSINLDLSGFDTSNVTNMEAMFYYFGRNSETVNMNLSGWDISNLADYQRMFEYMGNVANSFNLNLREWTLPDNDIHSLFYHMAQNASSINMNLSGWDISRLTDLNYIFDDLGYHSTTFNLDIRGWNTSNVTAMSAMFCDVAPDATERNILLPPTNGNGINNTDTIIYGIDETVYASINKTCKSEAN